MNENDLIRMGKEAGLCDKEGRDDNSIIITDHLGRFAALVAAAAIRDDWLWQAETETAVLAEREAAEERVVDLFSEMETPYLPDIVKAIQAKEQT